MSRHEGVSCDSCLKSNFRGKRYKCLICYDYDLCATCYEAGATTTRHTTDHAVQCIITRSDFDIFYGGEAITAEQPQSVSCPYCSKMGFTEALLQEHVAAEHADISVEVVCPICASLPGGDPNHVTDDFAAHLTLEHRTPREFEEPTGIRNVRRIPHPGRGASGVRTRRATNMHFSSGGATLTGISPSGREAMDPIAELLSQLSSVRSRAAAAQSVTSQLHQLEMQLQTTRQQLERTPRRIADAAKVTSSATGVTANADSQAATGGGGNNNNSSSNSLYLLSRCADSVIDESSMELQQERSKRSLFVQELLLSTLTEQLNVNDNTLENLEKLSDKVLSPLLSGESETDKNESSTSEGATDLEKETSAVIGKSPSTDVVSQSNGDASDVSKTIGVKSVDKSGTRQKVVTSAPQTSVSGRGATGSQPSRGGSRPIHYQSQQQGDRHSHSVHIRHGGLMSNNVELANNLSLNVARGGGQGYDGENPQPLPGRPGSGGRDREGRMNPPTAKRNMVKHLPTSKASDREPPPH